MNILLYKGQSQYDVLRFFIDDMAAAFTKLGHNAFMVDLLEKDWVSKLTRLLTDRSNWDFVFAFNGMGIDITSNNRSLYDIMDVPFVAAMVDHPCYHIPELNTKMNNLILTCIDRTHLDFLAAHYTGNQIKARAFLPHGGSGADSFSVESLSDYLGKRTIPLLFTGSFKKLEKTWSHLSPGTVRLLDDMTDYILGNENVTLYQAYSHVLKQRGIELGHEIFQKTYIHLFNVDVYVRGYLRQTCLETIAKAEIPIVLYGKNWDNWLNHKKYKSITYLGERDYQSLFGELRKTRLFLNNAHNYIYGAHERDFNAMLNGAVSVTQFNDYYNEEFIDGKDIVLYKIKELDGLPDKITRLLDNPETTWQIASAARKKAETRHTWLHRAEKVSEMVEIYKNLIN